MVQPVVAYAFASLPEAIETQHQELRSWASDHRVHVVAWHDDVGSEPGPITETRPGLLEAIAALRNREASTLVVTSARQLGDVSSEALARQLARHAGGRVLTTDDREPSSEVTRLMDRFDDYHRAVVSARTRALRTRAKEEGGIFGRAPWGYKVSADGTRWVREVKEQQVLAVIAHMRSRGMKFREICDELDVLGLRSRAGTRIGTTRVYELLKAIENHPRYERHRRTLEKRRTES
jgi:DNA invertase Pin-like site-specific DNA recombinase